MTKSFTLHFAELYEVACRSLSIIGKRAVDKDGNTLFETITPSTREEQLFRDFFFTALTSITTELRKFVENVSILVGGVGTTYPFALFDDDVTMIENAGIDPVPSNAQIIFADDSTVPENLNHKFYMRVPDNEAPGEYIYYATWNGATTGYQDQNNNYKPYSGNYYKCNGKLYQWNGTDMVAVETDSTILALLTLEVADDYNTALDVTTQQALEAYLVAYALYSWLIITYPRLADKYLSDANAQRSFAISQLFHRKQQSNLPNPLRQLTPPQ